MNDFTVACVAIVAITLIGMIGATLTGCTTSSDGWHQDEIDWIIQNG